MSGPHLVKSSTASGETKGGEILRVSAAFTASEYDPINIYPLLVTDNERACCAVAAL